MAALRVMEVRQAYACESFEWDQLRRIAERDGQAANVSLLRGRVRPWATRDSFDFCFVIHREGRNCIACDLLC